LRGKKGFYDRLSTGLNSSRRDYRLAERKEEMKLTRRDISSMGGKARMKAMSRKEKREHFRRMGIISAAKRKAKNEMRLVDNVK
jgi:hypothetical protein